jgi:hypothetical protein
MVEVVQYVQDGGGGWYVEVPAVAAILESVSWQHCRPRLLADPQVVVLGVLDSPLVVVRAA